MATTVTIVSVCGITRGLVHNSRWKRKRATRQGNHSPGVQSLLTANLETSTDSMSMDSEDIRISSLTSADILGSMSHILISDFICIGRYSHGDQTNLEPPPPRICRIPGRSPVSSTQRRAIYVHIINLAIRAEYNIQLSGAQCAVFLDVGKMC